MIRRSRISVRPNVGRPGRAGVTATPQDAPPPDQTPQDAPPPDQTPQDAPPPDQTPQDAPPPNQTPAESTANVEDNNSTTTAEVENNNDSSPAGLTVQGEATENSGEASTTTPAPTTNISSASVQRRKRFSVKPKVSAAPNRASARPNPNGHVQTSTSKPTAKEGLGGPPGSDQDEPPPTAAGAAAHQVDPVAQAHQEGAGAGNKHSGDDTDLSKPSATVPAQETPVEPPPRPSKQAKNLEGLPASRAKAVPPKPPDKVPVLPSLPEREAMAISERAKTLVSKSTKVGQLPQTLRLSHLLHDQTDLQRLAKARRLRELLRQEMGKEKEKQRNRKSKYRAKEYALDPSKMTMRDLVHYLPMSNPMTSYLDESTPENETVVPPSPGREESPEIAKDPEAASQRANDEDDDDEEGGGEGEDAMMVPRVKVAEDGSLIIDEESLTVEVKRAKGPNPADDGDAIFERGSTTTYSSFRKKAHTKAWSSEETDMFFLAVSMVGTDFSMICQLFPHRARSEIKNKFKKEERENSWRVDKAFKERRRLDLKFFSKLLEKILEFQSNKKKKPKAPSQKKYNRKPKKKTNGRTPAMDLSDVEEEPLEEDGEDGQEDPDYVGGERGADEAPEAPVDPASPNKPTESDSSPQKPKNTSRKRSKKEQDLGPDLGRANGEDGQEDPDYVGGERGADEAPEAPVDPASPNKPTESDSSPQKPKNTSRKRSKKEQAEASVPEEAEATLPEGHSTVNQLEDVESVTAASVVVIQPAKPSHARAFKPLLPLRRKPGKAAGPVSQDAPVTNSQDVPDTVETLASDALSTEQVDKDPSPLSQAKKRKLEYDDDDDDDDNNDEDNSSQDEEVSTIKLNLKPTRYGRMPKATQHLNYPAKEDSTADSASPRRPPTTSTPRPKRPLNRASKKPKLFTLRVLESDRSDDDEEAEGAERKKPEGLEEEEEDQPHASDPTEDSYAPVFVPVGLRSPHPVVSVVEETMEELDILVHVPDVLDISQDIPHHVSCEHAQDETDTVPFEHSLDLLADVINFLSPDHVEVSDNEAAHTLLTIGNRSLQSLLAHIEDPLASDYTTEVPTVSDPDTAHQKEDVDPNCDIQSSSLPPVTAPPDAPTHAVDMTHPDSRATHSDPETLMEDEPVPDTPDESSSRNGNGPLTALSAETEPSQRQSKEETTVAATSPPSKRGRLPKVKPKPNLLPSSRVAQPTQKPMSFQSSFLSFLVHKPDRDQMLEAKHKEDASEEALLPPAVEGASCVPQTSTGGSVPASGGELVEETPASQEETAARGHSLESEPQSETSVKSDSQDEAAAKMTLETGPEVTTGNETGTDSPPSHSSADVSAKGELFDSQAKLSEVVPLCPTTRRRHFPKVKPKPNLGQRGRAAPSVESDPVKAIPGESALSSQPHLTEDTVIQSEPKSTRSATDDTKTPCSTSPSVPMTEMGSNLTPTGTGVSREERKTDGVEESPGRTRSQLQPTKDNLSDISKQDDTLVLSDVNSERQPVVDNGPRSEPGTRPENDQRAVTSSPQQISQKKTSAPLGLETSGCTGSQRPREDREQETSSSPGTTSTTTLVPQPPQGEEKSSTAEGGPAGGDGADRPSAGSQDSVSDVSSSQTEETEEATRMQPQSVAMTQRRRFSKVKPKPNLGTQASRVGHAKHLPTRPQVTQPHPRTVSDTLREALPLISQSGGDASDEHIRPLRSSSVSVVSSTATESSLNPSVESPPKGKNSSRCTISQTSFVATESPEPQAPAATLTRDTTGEGATSGHGASWLIQNPFTAVDLGVAEVFPSAAVPTAPPSGQETSTAFMSDRAPPSKPLSLHATETATPTPQTALPVLPDQVPSDPDEPFFILSLTEIPVFPTGEGAGGVSEPRPYLPGTDAALQPQSDPATPGSSSGGGGGPCLHWEGPTSTEECAAAAAGSLGTQTAHGTEKSEHRQDPAPVHRATELLEAVGGSVEFEPPSKTRRASSVARRKNRAPSPPAAETQEAVAETVENEEPPCKKRRGPGPGRKAKLEVQPKCTGKRQTRRTSAVKELTAEAEQKGSTDSQQQQQQQQQVSTDLVEAEQGARTQEKADAAASSQPIDTQSSNVTRPPETHTLKRPGRKPKGFLSFLSDKPTPGLSGSPGSKVKAPPLAPRVKTLRGAARTPGPSEDGARKTPSTDVSVAAECEPGAVASAAPSQVSLAVGRSAEPRPSTSGSTAEVADDPNDQQDVGLEEEEPTNISQYFLSDIFTEVDE